MNRRIASLVLIVALAAAARVGLSQEAPPPPQGDNGGGPGGGRGGAGGGPQNFNPQEMRQRMMDRMKDELGVKDDEWKVLQPKIEKVMSAQRDLRAGGRGPGGPGGPGFGGPPRDRGGQGDRAQGDRGGDRGPAGQDGANDRPRPPQDQPQSAVARAQQDLRTTLENPDVSADKIAAGLKTLREARDKAKSDLASAQKDLKDVISPKQEAQLVVMGMLE